MQDSLPEIAAPVKKHKPLWEKLQPPLSESLRALLFILHTLCTPFCTPAILYLPLIFVPVKSPTLKCLGFGGDFSFPTPDTAKISSKLPRLGPPETPDAS